MIPSQYQYVLLTFAIALLIAGASLSIYTEHDRWMLLVLVAAIIGFVTWSFS